MSAFWRVSRRRVVVVVVVVVVALRRAPSRAVVDDGGRARMASGKRRAPPRPLFAPAMRSMKKAREVTTKFHDATRTLESRTASREARAAAEATLDAIGGREAYQAASALTTSRHRTAKWTFSVLTRLGRRPGRGERALRTLEVGAINTDLMSAKFLDVRAIDVRSRHPKIEQIDFFDLPVERLAGAYDVVHSSMVVNCVSTAEMRGEMLARTVAMLRANGLFFLMLPRRCVTSSSRMSLEKLTRLLRACGLRVVEQKSTPKVMFFCCEKLAKPASEDAMSSKAIAARDAREAFARREREKDLAGDRDDFGVVLADAHLCGF